MQICNEKEKAEKGNIYKVMFEVKRSTRKYNGIKTIAQGNKNFREEADAKWNERNGDFRERSHPAKFPTFENY